MSSVPKVLAFAGSARKDSFNKKLLRIAAAAARSAGAEVTVLDMRDLPMPLYDGDLEAAEGLPANVKKFKELMLAHQGLLLSCPEYNSGITPLLKNAIDWASRPLPGEGALACYVGKVAGLVSASPGALGGLRGLVQVRAILGNINVLVIPQQFALAKAHEAFDADGNLKDAAHKAAVENIGTQLAKVLAKMSA
jgi:NAD(P)H-dependent FMN reductase